MVDSTSSNLRDAGRFCYTRDFAEALSSYNLNAVFCFVVPITDFVHAVGAIRSFNMC
jgi:hypothetical protein